MPLTDEQIRRHREQRDHRDQWQADVAALQQIVDRLRTQYSQHKGDFAVGRYEELKVLSPDAEAAGMQYRPRRRIEPLKVHSHQMRCRAAGSATRNRNEPLRDIRFAESRFRFVVNPDLDSQTESQFGKSNIPTEAR